MGFSEELFGASGNFANDGFDLVAHLRRQRAFSERTFGPGTRAAGVVAHIRKELVEIEAAPGDLMEWIDVIMLALDGAWRSGHSPEQIAEALGAKARKERKAEVARLANGERGRGNRARPRRGEQVTPLPEPTQAPDLIDPRTVIKCACPRSDAANCTAVRSGCVTSFDYEDRHGERPEPCECVCHSACTDCGEFNCYGDCVSEEQ